MLQQTMDSVAQGLDSPADTKFSKSSFVQGLEKNVMTADEERVFMHLSGR